MPLAKRLQRLACDLGFPFSPGGSEWTKYPGQRLQGRPSSFLARESNNLMTTISNSTVPSRAPEEQDLHRQLIQQFYENSIERYGPDSEQTQMFAQHLSAYSALSE
jgi:hypothetical protein